MHKNIIILAGGMSSRMKNPSNVGITKEEEQQANQRSKALIEVGQGRPLLDYLLNNIKKSGYENVYILISEKPGMFKEFYGQSTKNNNFHGLNISYATQYIPKDRTKPYGTADALYQTLEQYPELNETVYTVCNSDNLYSVDALKKLREETHPNAFIAYDRDGMDFPPDRVPSFALSKLDNDDLLLDILEKPPIDKVEQYRDQHGKLRVSMNAFKFDGKMFFDFVKSCPPDPVRDEKELPTALINMVKKHPKAMKAIAISEHVPDLTSKKDIHQVKDYLLKHYPKLDW